MHHTPPTVNSDQLVILWGELMTADIDRMFQVKYDCDTQVDKWIVQRGDLCTHLRSVSQSLVEENEISIEHVLLKEEIGQKGNVPRDLWWGLLY